MVRLWVIEWNFGDSKNEKWEVCSSAVADVPFVSTNFYEAHKNKKKIQEILKRDYNENWFKNRFRVREYRRIRNRVANFNKVWYS